MVLKGFSKSTFFGWFTGALLLKSPRGIPAQFVRKSPYTVFIIALNAVTAIVSIDFYIQYSSATQSQPMLTRFLNYSVVLAYIVFDIYFRLCFFFRAKLVPRFLKALENDMNKISLPFSHYEEKNWKFYNRLIWFIDSYHYLGAVIKTLWISQVLPNAYLLGFIPPIMYYVVYFVFIGILQAASTLTSAAFVVITTFHVLWVFEDFSYDVEEQIRIHDGEKPRLNANYVIAFLGDVKGMSETPGTSQFTKKLLSKFEHLKMLCNMYDKICGPLLLGLMVRAVFMLISCANSIMLFQGENGESIIKYYMDIFNFFVELSHLLFLEMGALVHRKVWIFSLY